MRIALLEDDNYQADVMRAWLESAGHECRVYPTGQAFREGMRCGDFDLAILDWVLPDTDGVAVLAWLREHCEWHIPVIFVTRMDREEDVVIALEKGADDYMTKPVKPREMQARIAAVARRVHLPTERTDLLEVGDYRLNLQSRTVELGGERVDLTHKEFELLRMLMVSPGSVVRRAGGPCARGRPPCADCAFSPCCSCCWPWRSRPRRRSRTGAPPPWGASPIRCA